MASVWQRSPGAALPGRVCRRALRTRSLRVRAAAPPTSSAPSTVPLTKQDLVQHLRSGCKPRDKWRCGARDACFPLRRARARKNRLQRQPWHRGGGDADDADPTPLRTRSIGTEHEKFGFRKADKRPIDYNEVKHLLLGLVNRRVLRQSVARARRAAPPRTAHAAEHLATQVWLGAHPRKGLHHRCQA